MEPDSRLRTAWDEHRGHLISVAFRMLGDIGEAEDVVQEAYTRLLQADLDSVEDARGWLVVVTSRLCLDQIKSARSRRQRPADLGAFEATLAGGGADFVDPADRVTLDDSVRLALIVVLDHLTPAERVVFVLHEIFQMPFELVGETIGRSAAACRQLARRGRVKVDEAGGRSRLGIPTSEHRVLTERFIAACTDGSLDALLEVLDPEVSGEIDIRHDQVTVGADQVSANLLRFWGPPNALVAYQVGDQPAVLAFHERRLRAVLLLTLDEDLITKVHVMVSPVSLSLLDPSRATSA